MQATAPNRSRPSETRRHRTLHALLGDLVRAHEALMEASIRQRAAMRGAEPEAIGRAREEMAGACLAIASLDEERRAIVGAMAPGKPDTTLSALAALLPEPERSRALELAARLRELIALAAAEQRRLQSATESMLRHVRGVVHHVQRRLSHAGVYGRAGRVEPGAAVVSGIDLTR
ncbi:MAG TPA: flagellar protein FlgN [Phycisphaerales bacterium]|nr:flagellar protein FlgN [Phycisphaerales bacterium]